MRYTSDSSLRSRNERSLDIFSRLVHGLSMGNFMNLRKAAEMALEVFDGPVLKDATEHAMRLRKACDLLRQALAESANSTTNLVEPKALAQPEQEPVAWSVLDKRTGKHWYTHESKYTAQHYANEYSHKEPDGSPSMMVKPLYTAPPSIEAAVLAEREACAKIVEADGLARGNEGLVLIKAAKRIRARGEK
jgi:hypothetical protein